MFIISAFVTLAALARSLAPPADTEHPYVMPQDGTGQTPKPPRRKTFNITAASVSALRRQVTFILTEETLSELQKNDLPETIRKKLLPIKNRHFSEKQQFSQAVKTLTGKNAFTDYEELILEQARKRVPSRICSFLKAFEGKTYKSEAALVSALSESLGKDDAERYGRVILKLILNENDHIWGTLPGQYDIFYGIIWGTRTAFQVGLVLVGIACFIGVMLGMLSGYYGGWLDETVMRLVDMAFAIPRIVVVMAIAASSKNLWYIIFAVALVQWREYARLMRGETLSLRNREFVLAAKALGASDFNIMHQHIFPHAVWPVLALASLDIGSVVMFVAFLSFLGFTPDPGYADWGRMLALSKDVVVGPSGDFLAYWHTYAFPGSALALFVLGWTCIGDALRDAFDPKRRKK